MDIVPMPPDSETRRLIYRAARLRLASSRAFDDGDKEAARELATMAQACWDEVERKKRKGSDHDQPRSM